MERSKVDILLSLVNGRVYTNHIVINVCMFNFLNTLSTLHSSTKLSNSKFDMKTIILVSVVSGSCQRLAVHGKG